MFRSYDHHQAEKYIATLGLLSWQRIRLERGPLSLVSTTEELLGRNSSGSGLEIREYSRRDLSRWLRGTFYPQKSGH
jgi:hypothetical protein